MFLICILLCKLIEATHVFRIITTALLLSISILFAPVEAKNKPLNEKKRLKYKTIASILSAIDFIFALLNALPSGRNVTCYYLSKWVLIIFAVGPLYQRIKPDRTIWLLEKASFIMLWCLPWLYKLKVRRWKLWKCTIKNGCSFLVNSLVWWRWNLLSWV